MERLCAAAFVILAVQLGLSSTVAAACPNEAFRTGPSAALPDCRAYEMVSPVGLEPYTDQSNGGELVGVHASVTGGRIGFYSYFGSPVGSYSSGPYFLSARGPSGWSTEDVIPPQTTAGDRLCTPWVLYSPDLSQEVLQDGWNWGEGFPGHPDDENCENGSHDEPALVEAEPRGAMNLFLRGAAGGYQLVNETPTGNAARDAWFQAGSADFSHIVFTDPLLLTPEAPAPSPQVVAGFAVGEDLYEWLGGTVRLVTILPEGKAAWGLLANGSESLAVSDSAPWTHAVSSDGERIFFYAEGTVVPGETFTGRSYVGANLYLRENAGQPRDEECAGPSKACTVQIDAAQGGAEAGGGRFEWASADGTRAFFTDERRLTVDSKAQMGKPDLYEYDVAKPAGERLSDLTAGGTEPASVQGLSGVSEDGSHVYFVATGDLTGEQANSQGEKAQVGRPNLYLHMAGADTFIARLDALGEDSQPGSREGDTCDWDSFTAPGEEDPVTSGEVHKLQNCMSARISADGSFLAFQSKRSLTGYNNVVEATGLRAHEIFLYDAAENRLTCASCNPTGAPPTADAVSGEADPRVLPPTKGYPPHATPTDLSANLTNDGQVFFETQNALLPADENGQINVYEYQAGRLSLISDGGKGTESSFFLGASANGADVYLATTEPLVGSDTDNTMSLYDAREGGGFAEPPSPSPACEAEEACRGPFSVPPGGATPLTAGFVGPGNQSPPSPHSAPPPPHRCKAGFKLVKVHHKSFCKRIRKFGKRKPLAHAKRGARR